MDKEYKQQHEQLIGARRKRVDSLLTFEADVQAKMAHLQGILADVAVRRNEEECRGMRRDEEA